MYPDYPVSGLMHVGSIQTWPEQRNYRFHDCGRRWTENIQSSLLGKTGGPIKCPLVTCLGLDFGGLQPIAAIRRIMRSVGFQNPEELREKYLQVSFKCICHATLNPNRLPVRTAEKEAILTQALMLGLCTTTYFDPTRPIIWTNASLTRCLDLYDVKGFYI